MLVAWSFWLGVFHSMFGCGLCFGFEEKPGFFDGLHFHLHVKLDELTSIDTLSSETTWSTTYVKLLEDSLWLPAGQRIACRCKAWSRGSRGSMRCYSVRVCLGETEVATFHWEGCT